jgi:hypothetical protein
MHRRSLPEVVQPGFGRAISNLLGPPSDLIAMQWALSRGRRRARGYLPEGDDQENVPTRAEYPLIPLICARRGLSVDQVSLPCGKYHTQAQNHEQQLALLLGQTEKERARFFRLQWYQQPELVTVNT